MYRVCGEQPLPVPPSRTRMCTHIPEVRFLDAEFPMQVATTSRGKSRGRSPCRTPQVVRGIE